LLKLVFDYSWIEHDPYDLLDTVIRCSDEAVRKFGMMGHNLSDLKGKKKKKAIIYSTTFFLT
jgi:hypothetical protein